MDIYKLRKIFKRYTQGKANETEGAMVEAWYRSYSSNEDLPQNEAEINELHQAMRHNIRSATIKRKLIQMPAFRIAASVALFFTISFLTWKIMRRQEYAVVSTGTNGLKEIQLADGSTIWLNAASRFKMPNEFTGKFREVILEEGEAFFSIKKDKEHPFIVHTPKVNVQVLGTSFNVKAYHNLHFVSVTVATGKVGVMANKKTLALLTPGQQLNYDLFTGLTHLQNIDPDEAKGWKEGSTYLHEADFAELALLFKNIYGLNIKAGTKDMAGYRFSLRLMHSLPPQQALDLIGQLHQTHFRKEGNEIVLY